MSITVGKYEVRCTPMAAFVVGTTEQRFSGHWSVYLLPVDDSRDDAVAEGETDEFPSYALAEQEGFRQGMGRAKILDEGTTDIESYS
ncbi:MAG: hypothetical protein GAK28_02928 [Luteibacter sp.]|uniref:hypothetical protein n=1 Tax=Luteibacter sp. TaxID=1886636 RepID=UPI0013852E63|nr:hypothetical protein [Luteibacter sp.]KAF1006020.1 MAG: hypothetical protein GAK28_02928 [Luteibacter sp.]